MGRPLKFPLSVVAMIVLLTQAGCGSLLPQESRLPQELPPPAPSLTSIAALGRTGVTATWEAPDLQLAEPPKGWAGGFGRGAAVGAGTSVVGGLAVGIGGLPMGYAGPIWAVGWTAVGVALAPIGAAVGGIVGAFKAQPPEQVERGKAALVDAVAAADLPATLRDRIIRLGSDESWHTLVPVAGRKPDAGDPEVGTVLVLVIRYVGLAGRIDPATGKPVSVWADMDPELQLKLDVDAQLFKVSDGSELYMCSFHAFGAVRKFSAWAADDGRRFREGLAAASDNVASQIAKAVFPGAAACVDVRCAAGTSWNEVQAQCVPCEPAPAWCQGERTEWTGVRCIRR